MARARTIYRCSACGAMEPKWAGRCSACGAWNELVEEHAAPDRSAQAERTGPRVGPRPIAEVDTDRWAPGAHPRGRARPGAGRAASCRGRSPCSAASRGSASPRCCCRRWPAWPRTVTAASTSRAEESAAAGAAAGRAARAPCRPTCGWCPTTALPTCSTHVDGRRARRAWRSTRSRPCSTPTSASAPGSVAQVRECAHRLVRRGQGPRAGHGAGRPRHQGRRPGRPPGARAPRRHRPGLRGRPAPRPAPAAGRQAPLRRHRRARPVRDDRRRARGRPRPVGAVPRRPPPGHRRARSSCPCSTGTGRCWSRCRPSSPPRPLAMPRRSAQGLDSGRLALRARRARAAVRAPFARARRAHASSPAACAPSSRAPTSPLALAARVGPHGHAGPARPRRLRRGRARRRAAPGAPDRRAAWPRPPASGFRRAIVPARAPPTLPGIDVLRVRHPRRGGRGWPACRARPTLQRPRRPEPLPAGAHRRPVASGRWRPPQRRAHARRSRVVAPGTPLRDGLDRILQAEMGALVVVGDGPEVLNICSGGFLLDAAFSPQRLSELAKMDGAIILAADASRIARANVHLVPEPERPHVGDRHPAPHRRAGGPVDRRAGHLRLRGHGGRSPSTSATRSTRSSRSRGSSPGPTRPPDARALQHRLDDGHRRALGPRGRGPRHPARRRHRAPAHRDGAAHRRGDRAATSSSWASTAGWCASSSRS